MEGMADDRPVPHMHAPERKTLEDFLDFHRATLAWKCDGLTDEQLRSRPVPSSNLSLVGLVRHMGEVERSWFRNVLQHDKVPYHYWTEGSPDADFDDVANADVAEAFDYWRSECDFARSALAEHASLDDVGMNLRRGFDVSLRWILVHMIEEYARHNGHADLLREAIDGAVGE